MTTTIHNPANTRHLRQRLLLLVGQGVSLGLMLAFIVVTGMTLMLDTYGAQAVPYVYILVAVLGSLLFFGYGELQRRRPLPTLSLATLGLTTLFLGLTWVGLVWARWQWLAFLVFMSFSLLIQVGFVVIGAQAGRLLDVREIKRYFPRIVSGFVGGFIIGGALVGPITAVNNRPADMLLAATAVALLFCGLILLTNRRHGAVLARSAPTGPERQPPPLRRLLAQRTVVLLLLYQMLSAIATQVFDYMVLAVTGARFADGPTLAAFFGRYTVFLNVTDLLFVLLLAGVLLSRFGLRFGLLANPAVVVGLLAAVIAAGVGGGPASDLFFWLVIATRITDLTVTDGTTRTAINAAYQALPAHERAAVQTAVEGIGVPVALGLTGLILLLFQAIPGLTLVHLAAFTLGVSLLWLLAGGLVYRGYAGGLLQTMRRRALQPADMRLDDASTFAVVERLLHSDRLTDVRLALDMLTEADHPTLDQQLLRLAASAPEAVSVEALTRLADRPAAAARPVVAARLADESPAVRSAAIRAYCALEGERAVAEIAPLLAAADDAIREAAFVGLLRCGGPDGAAAAALLALSAAETAADRRLAARIIGAVGGGDFVAPLRQLLQDADGAVRHAALRAAAAVPRPALVPQLVSGLAEPATRSAAVEALLAAGDAVLPLLAAALAEPAADPAVGAAETAVVMTPAVRRHLVRIGGQLPGEGARPLLQAHLAHPDPELRGTILKAALHSGVRLQAGAQLLPALRLEAHAALACLTARLDVGEGAGLQPLQRALDDGFRLTQQRVLLLLRLAYDARAMTRVGELLAQAPGAQQALALELLEVSLLPEHRAAALPILNPQLSLAQRCEQLRRQADVRPIGQMARLQALLRDPDDYWRQAWLRAGAAYAVGQLGLRELAAELARLRDDPDPVVRETAVWGLEQCAVSS